MPNKNKSKKGVRGVKNTRQNPSISQRKKSTLGRNLLQAAGGGLGGFLGGPLGRSIGNTGATWLSDVLGMGDYSINANTLMDPQGVPRFRSGDHSVRIAHREFLGDITGSTAFVSREYHINPGDASTFPWLSGVAANFQEYKFHGLLFEFVSTSADALNSVNTALGTVVMATQYNPGALSFVSKAEMEQYEFSCSSKPSKSLIHPVECKPSLNSMSHLYIRTSDLEPGQVPQFYELGDFQLATVGMQASAVIGELWVTYDVECYKPRINQNLSPAISAYKLFRREDCVAGTPFGFETKSSEDAPRGDLDLSIIGTIDGDVMAIGPDFQSGWYHVTFAINNQTVSLAATLATPVSNNSELYNLWGSQYPDPGNDSQRANSEIDAQNYSITCLWHVIEGSGASLGLSIDLGTDITWRLTILVSRVPVDEQSWVGYTSTG